MPDMPCNKQNKRMRPGLLLSLVIGLAAAWLAVGTFLPAGLLRLVLALAFGSCLGVAFVRRQSGRQLRLAQEQFKWFLELIITRLSSGTTLERAISDALPGMEQLLGRTSPFLQQLRETVRQLDARRPLDELLLGLARRAACPDATHFFQMLPELRRTGSQVTTFVRQNLRMVTEQLQLQQTVWAETAQRRLEAAFLSLMPFLLAATFRSSFDAATTALMAQPAGLAGMAAACCLAIAAAALTAGNGAVRPWKVPPARPRRVKPVLPGRLSAWLNAFYLNGLPAAYSARLLLVLAGLGQRGGIDPVFFWRRKLRLIGLGLLPGLVASMVEAAAWPLVLVFPILLSVLQDQQLLAAERKIQDDYRLNYPLLLNLLSALLLAGLSLHRSLQIACSALQPATTSAAGLARDLDLARSQLQAGQPIRQILHELLAACPVPEAQAALLLLLRYEAAGSPDVLQLLDLQASSCWTLHRNAARKKLEQQNLRLIIPMTLDLAAVLLTALLPAVLSLQVL